MPNSTLPGTGEQSAERVDWTYVNNRIADAMVSSGPAHRLAVQREAADSAARLMSLVRADHRGGL